MSSTSSIGSSRDLHPRNTQEPEVLVVLGVAELLMNVCNRLDFSSLLRLMQVDKYMHNSLAPTMNVLRGRAQWHEENAIIVSLEGFPFSEEDRTRMALENGGFSPFIRYGSEPIGREILQANGDSLQECQTRVLTVLNQWGECAPNLVLQFARENPEFAGLKFVSGALSNAQLALEKTREVDKTNRGVLNLKKNRVVSAFLEEKDFLQVLTEAVSECSRLGHKMQLFAELASENFDAKQRVSILRAARETVEEVKAGVRRYSRGEGYPPTYYTTVAIAFAQILRDLLQKQPDSLNPETLADLLEGLPHVCTHILYGVLPSATGLVSLRDIIEEEINNEQYNINSRNREFS